MDSEDPTMIARVMRRLIRAFAVRADALIEMGFRCLHFFKDSFFLNGSHIEKR